MELVLREIVTRCTAGERLALCVVVGSRGSTPQEAGAKMLVLADGRTIGTLGGGCVEAEVRRRALELLPGGVSKRLQFRLDHDYGWDDGLICGGTMDILVHLLDGRASVEPFARAMDDLAALKGVIQYPSRIKCATLAWTAFQQGLEEVAKGDGS